MCGFAGFITNSDFNFKECIRAMSGAIKHRGPDSDGVFVDNIGSKHVALGFRRLSIQDLSSQGNQPMHLMPENRYVMVFNGEVYNFNEIRKELENLGYSFRSQTDSEVVLAAFDAWGLQSVHKMIGMFSFAILDKRDKKLYLCRDRAGVKPLFYYFKNSDFIFGSELKSFHQHPNFEKEISNSALASFFQNKYVPAPNCIFQNTLKLLPGHWLIYDIEKNKLELNEYWNYWSFLNKPIIPYNSITEAISQGQDLFESAFNYRMIADVPVGVFLSGGYDSSLVTGLLAQKHNNLSTFTIGFEEEAYNEANYAKQVANYLGTKHHEQICTYKEARDIVPDLAFYYDEPLADSSVIPSILLANFARKNVTVTLSADGGDEIFGGYDKYYKTKKYLAYLSKFPMILKKLASLALHLLDDSKNGIQHEAKRNKLKLLLQSKSVAESFHIITQLMTLDEINTLLLAKAHIDNDFFIKGSSALAKVQPMNAVLGVDFKTFLVDDVMQKVDRASMSVSLEAREPLLDHRIAEWAAQLPIEYKIHPNQSKYILKEMAYKYVPKELLDRPKQGFRAPIEKWLKNELKDLLLDNVNNKDFRDACGLNMKVVDSFMNDFFANSNISEKRIFPLFTYALWWNQWMK